MLSAILSAPHCRRQEPRQGTRKAHGPSPFPERSEEDPRSTLIPSEAVTREAGADARSAVIRNLAIALDGEKLALLAAVGGALNAIDDIAS